MKNVGFHLCTNIAEMIYCYFDLLKVMELWTSTGEVKPELMRSILQPLPISMVKYKTCKHENQYGREVQYTPSCGIPTLQGNSFFVRVKRPKMFFGVVRCFLKQNVVSLIVWQWSTYATHHIPTKIKAFGG